MKKKNDMELIQKTIQSPFFEDLSCLKDIHNRFLEYFLEKQNDFYLELFTQLFGRVPDITKDKGRVEFVSYIHIPNVKEVYFDKVLVGRITEDFVNYKIEFKPL